MIILHGGSSNTKAHRATSAFYARCLAWSGITVLTYDKRGTGASDGEVQTATFDDYVSDALAAVTFLKNHERLETHKVGILGPSQGGRIAALAAAGSSDVSFIVTLAAPLVSIADVCYFSSLNFLKRMGISDSEKIKVLPLWQKHYASIEKNDQNALQKLDKEIIEMAAIVDKKFLPLKSKQLSNLKDFGMGDFQPMYNSMQNDYITELAKIKIPWLSIYGELDKAVPVQASVKIMKDQMDIAGNNKYEIKIIPNVGHGFRNAKTKQYYPVEKHILDWLVALKLFTGETN